MLTEYLLSHHKCDLEQILRHEDIDKHFSINVNFLALFEDDAEVGNKVLREPDGTLEACNESIMKAQRLLKSELNEEELTSKSNVAVRIHNLLSCPELTRAIFPKSQDLGLFLQVSGTVVRTTCKKVLEFRRRYVCTKCKDVVVVKADFDLKYVIMPPARCNNSDECKGNNMVPLGSLDSANCKDYQEIKMQEQVSKLGIGKIPNAMRIILEDDLVETCKPGDDITVCGIIKRRWKLPSVGKKLEVELVIKANHVLVNNDTSAAVVTQDIKLQFESFWKQHETRPLYGRDLILKSFCPQIYGLYMVKLAVMVVLAGGSQFRGSKDTGVRTRSEAHLLLVGDPGTGKSQLLRFASKVIPRSVLTTGVGSTSAGLTATAVLENGEWELEGGALVLSDGGLCCIDEFNSMKEHDRTSIHEAMEQQTISVAKASIVCKLNTRCTILAATNPKGNLDSSQPLRMNIALASPLLSRFDLVLILKDTIDEEWDSLVVDYILDGHKIANDQVPWSLETLQTYYSVIKTIHPVLTERSNKILGSYYHLQRRSTQRNKARTTVRLLDSLVRLSQAHARLMFHARVEVMDAVFAVVLSEASMQGDAAVLSLEFDVASTYPSDPTTIYSELAETVLEKLELSDIFEKERRQSDCNETNPLKVERDDSTAVDPSGVISTTDELNMVTLKSENDENSSKRKQRGTPCDDSVVKKTKTSDVDLLKAIPSVNDSFNFDFRLTEENSIGDESQDVDAFKSLSLTSKVRPLIDKFRFKPAELSVFSHSRNKVASKEAKPSQASSVFESCGAEHFNDLDLDI